MDIGVPELVLTLVFVIILFGPGRLSKTMGELGHGIKTFRNEMNGKDDDQPKKEDTTLSGNIK